jgi:uncharacterized protein (DUF305 family)
MRASFARGIAAFIAVLVAACGGASGGQARAGAGVQPASAPAPLGGFPHTAADVHFMSGMIGHHAQAVLMASWAPTHDASPSLRALCERIVVGQRDEIALMQTWLRDRGEKVADADPKGMKMMMNGVEHTMLMPGMLSEEQMAQLDKARGTEFDRLFLTFMIQHHEGAVAMVDALFASPGAGQDEIVFKLSSDIYADQTTEIERMHKMLTALPNADRRP